MNRAAVLPILLCLAFLDARAGEGVVQTRSGKTLTGAIQFSAEGLTLKPSTGDPVKVALDDIVELQQAGESPAASPVPPHGPPASGGAAASTASGAAGGWTPSQVGSGPAGKVAEESDGMVVSGAGLGLRGSSDNLLFAQRRLDTAGQIVAKLEAFDGTLPEALAGLLLRDNLGEAAAYAFIGQRTGTGICFQYRQIAGGMTLRTTNVAIALPAWLRLSRVGGAVVAEASADGREWQAIGRANVNVGQAARAGLAVASGAEDAVATARFRESVVGARGTAYAPTSGYPRVLLRGGSILVAPVESGDESVIRLGGPFAGAMVSTLNLARIEYGPLTPGLRSSLSMTRQGVLLGDGDFLDGALRRIATNTVTVSSLLFGFRRFSAGSEAMIVMAGPVEPDEAPLQIRTRNGSELRARRLIAAADGLRAESPLLGSIFVRGSEIASVRREERK